MQTTTLPMLTIIAEEVLKERLIQDLKHAGVKGYTWTLVEGEGSRHMRAGEIPGQNIKLEVITTAEVTDRLLGGVDIETGVFLRFWEHWRN